MHLSQTCIMSTMCKLVFFLLNIIYRYCWGTLVIQITLLKVHVLQSTSPLQGRNGLLCNHNSFKNQWLLFPNRFSLHWGLRDSCIILNVSKRNEIRRIFIALKSYYPIFSSTHLKGHVGYCHHDSLEQENVQYKAIGYSDIHSSVDIRYLYSNIVNWHTFAYSVENWAMLSL
jgi:hypothetical protein